MQITESFKNVYDFLLDFMILSLIQMKLFNPINPD